MVKVEDFDEHSGTGEVSALGTRNQSLDALDEQDVKPSPAMIRVKEECVPSSSSSHLRSQFIVMGFSPTLVDKVLEENGETDPNVILETLFTHSALQESSPTTSSSLHEFSGLENEEANNKEIKSEPHDSPTDKRSYLLMMNFSEQEVDSALSQLGESAPLDHLADYIVTTQTTGFSGENEDTTIDEKKSEALYGIMDKSLYLLQMGFTEEEVSSAIEKFGQEASIMELADAVLARRMGNNVRKRGDMSNGEGRVKPEPVDNDIIPDEYSGHYAASYSASFYSDEEKFTVKKSKLVHFDAKEGSSSFSTPPSRSYQIGASPYNRLVDVKEEASENVGIGRSLRKALCVRPYLLYGNVLEVSNETWKKLSQFLYGLEPEFLNSQFFSALIRKEGYIHNIPTGNRLMVTPKSPMTIEDALPFTKKWWPSWDTRKQISCINAESGSVTEVCEKLERIVANSRGVLSGEQRTNILHQCKAFNLIWVGKDKLSSMEPHQIERMLGYPVNHTQIFGIEDAERMRTLKYCFQTDTMAYLLSPLKDLFPDGIRVLSIYSDIGAAEIALHRLGIPLKCVVSVEASETNRRILRRWWQTTKQSGELRQVDGIRRLTMLKLEALMKEFGGFDLVIGGNPGSSGISSTNNTSLAGMDSTLFFEYLRIFQRVRSTMVRNF